MKAALYGMQSPAGWKWTCTLNSNVDRFYRFERCEADAGIIWFEPSLSWGQAVWAEERLNRMCVKHVTLEKVRGELINGLSELGVDRARLERVRGYECRAAEWRPDGGFQPVGRDELERLCRLLAGRSLLPEELFALLEASGLESLKDRWTTAAQTAMLHGAVDLRTGLSVLVKKFLWQRDVVWRCRRCGSGMESLRRASCPHCGGACPYCEACLTMGRVRFCSVLLQGVGEQVTQELVPLKRGGGEEATQDLVPLKPGGGEEATQDLDPLRKWGLSPAQTEASREGVRFLERTAAGAVRDERGSRVGHAKGAGPPRFLIWAVTGAGKTEMIFPLVEHELSRGRKVLLTTPRRDVVLELLPRLKRAFPETNVVALYGGSEQRWEQGDLTLATTHQLLRYWRCFDLVVIDELDAFPYHNNPMLEYAARQVCKETGRYILLSATPPAGMQREVRAGRLPHVKVPVRYHRHPLPVPRRLAGRSPEQMVRTGRMEAALVKELQHSLDRGAQVFYFVPKIGLVEPFIRLLSREFSGKVVQGTSSHDEDRADKVMGFREKESHILVTTTILERGVTVPKTDVFIVGADAPLFDEASLVQMAGRAGRSKDDPAGRVFFVSKEWSKSQQSAIKQVRSMNAVARDKGYLIPVHPSVSIKGGVGRQ